jgi:uncharacterized protein YjbI with pentapeptide repeats
MTQIPPDKDSLTERLQRLAAEYRPLMGPHDDYAGKDLRGHSFAGEEVFDFAFRETQLDGASFQGAHIVGCNFIDAHLDAADFSQAHVGKSDFWQSSLTDATFDRAKLIRVSYSRSQLASASFVKTALQSVHFNTALVDGSSFRDASCELVSFCGASLEEVDFTGARFDDLYMAGVQGLETVRADWILVGDEVYFERRDGDAAHEYLRQAAQYSTAAAVRWRDAGQPWRYKPELLPQFQALFTTRRMQSPTAPFTGMRLTRTAIEWLVATNLSPMPLDLRGAQIDAPDLVGLPKDLVVNQ